MFVSIIPNVNFAHASSFVRQNWSVGWKMKERVFVFIVPRVNVFLRKPRGFYLNFEKFCISFVKFGPKKSFLEILILGINQDVISS